MTRQLWLTIIVNVHVKSTPVSWERRSEGGRVYGEKGGDNNEYNM